MNIREKISIVEILSQLDIDLAEELETMDKGEFTAYLAYLIKKYEGRHRENNRGSVGLVGSPGRENYGRGSERGTGKNSEIRGTRGTNLGVEEVKQKLKEKNDKEIEVKEEIKEENQEEDKDKIGTVQQVTSNDESLDTSFNAVQEMDDEVNSFLNSFMEL